MEKHQQDQPKADILIVDDTLPNLRLLSNMLVSNRYQVREAPDGPTALKLIRSKHPDLILLDIRMPGMDGYEVCQRLKADENTRHIPIIFVSALDEQSDIVHGLSLGGVDYITKPLQVKEVIARVETHLTLRILHKQLEAQNALLQQEVAERKCAEAALQKANEELEARVRERTTELMQINRALESELQDRKGVEEALRQRVAQLALLNHISSRITALVEVEPVLESAATLVQKTFGYHHVGIFLVDLEQGTVVMKTKAGGFTDLFPPGHQLKLGQGIVGWVGSKGETLLANDVDEEPRFINLYPEVIPTRAELSVPIQIGDKVIGVLDAQSPSKDAFDENDVMVMETVADQIAAAIDNARLYEVVQRELTERHKAEEALRDNVALLQSIFRAAPVGIGLVSNRVLLRLNDRICEMVGYSQSELLGKDARLLYPSDEDYEYVGSEKYAQIRERGTGTVETRWQHKNGQILNVLMSSTPLDPDNPEAGVTFTALDITERVQSETERERLLAQVREIMNTVPEGVLLIDTDDQVILANPVATRILKDVADAQVGDTLRHLGDRSLADLRSLPPKELWHEVKAGSLTFEVVSRPMVGGPEPQRSVMVIRDVTKEREIQENIQQQERLAAVGQLAAGIAHDFNNILAVILLYTEMALGQPELRGKLRERLSTISQQAKRASDLIQQILDFSRRAVLERRHTDLLPFLTEQANLLERTLPENININLSYTAGEYIVNADPTRMQQAIMNLAVNARDAMPEGGELQIDLSWLTSEDRTHCGTCGQLLEGHWMCIAIRDTGYGIAPEDLPHVFEPFFTTKEPGEGTGLGLAQVYGILRQHEGHVDVRSQATQGSTFNLYLPAFPVEESPPMDMDPISMTRGQGQMVLVAEDETVTRQALVDGLTMLGYQVIQIANGQEALEILKQRGNEIDLVLSDVVMPEMGGIALMRAMRDNGISTPVVLMTGHPMQKELEELQAKGLTAWLLKPPRLKQLSLVIAEALESVTDPVAGQSA